MLKEAIASKAAKLLMTCICPVAGTTALSLGVPPVREAVHKATQPRQIAKPKVRARPELVAAAMPVAAPAVEACPSVTPFALSDLPLETEAAFEAPPVQVAEAPSPDRLVSPLSRRIFVPMSGSPMGSPPMAVPGVPEPATWVQLILGFGLIGGVARVTYRKNGKQSDGEGERKEV